jgi:hypothetical protein
VYERPAALDGLLVHWATGVVIIPLNGAGLLSDVGFIRFTGGCPERRILVLDGFLAHNFLLFKTVRIVRGKRLICFGAHSSILLVIRLQEKGGLSRK